MTPFYIKVANSRILLMCAVIPCAINTVVKVYTGCKKRLTKGRLPYSDIRQIVIFGGVLKYKPILHLLHVKIEWLMQL